MACNNRNNVVLLFLGLLLISSLCQCTSLTKKLKENTISLSKILHWQHGKLLIGLKPEHRGKSKEAKDVDLDYQSDMPWEVSGRHTAHGHGFPKYDHTAVERLLKMDPTVDCSGSSMRLKAQHADAKPGALLFVDRGALSPLSLSKLPKSCGYEVCSTRLDLVLVAPYDGCFVVVEESRYVLPLLWFGLPVQMSCPLIQPSSHSNPPMVICHIEGMVVKTDWTSGLSEIKVILNGNWESVMTASIRCGFGVVKHPEGMTISISYNPCFEEKDGFYSVKLLKDNEFTVLCPSLASADPLKVRDVGLYSTPAPSQNLRTTPQVPVHPVPPSPSQTWNQFYPPYWYMQQPEAVQLEVPQPTDDKMVGQPFFPVYPEPFLLDGQNPWSVPPGLDESLGHSYYSMFYPNMPPQPVPEHPSQPDDPSQDSTLPYYREWYMPEPGSDYPYYPHDLVKPTASPERNPPPKPEGTVPPVYLYPYYYPTEQPELTTAATASPPQTVPQHYQPFGPYYYPLPYQHPLYMTSTPVPSTEKAHNPPISGPGTVVVPQNPKPDAKLVECSQYCQLGPNCCPQVAFHHHMYYFVPHDQYGNSNPQLFPLPGLPNGLGPNFVYGPSEGPQEVPVPPSYTAFTNALASSQLYPLRGQHERHTYNQPLEDNPAAQSENQPSEQTDNKPYPNFEPNAYFPYGVMNPWNHPEDPSSGTPLHYSEYFDPVQGTNMYSPYNVQSSQSDSPPAPNILSRIQQNARKQAKVYADVTGPASSAFHSQQEPQVVPYRTLQEQDNLSNHQSADSLRTVKREDTITRFSEPKDYVLLQQGPPSRQSSNPVQPPSYNPAILQSDFQSQKLQSNFPNDLLNSKEESEDLKRLEKENADQTPGDEPGPPLQTSSSAGPNSAPLSLDPVRQKPITFRFPKRPYSRSHA